MSCWNSKMLLSGGMLALLILFSLSILSALPIKPCSEYCEYRNRGLNQIPEELRDKMRVRKDVKCLTEEEWNRFANAMQILYNRGSLNDYTRIHMAAFRYSHSTAAFLPWHRWMIYQMEDELRTIDPRITLPYWDAAIDFMEPERSLVLSPERYGTNGMDNKTHCVRNGLPGNWTFTHPYVKCVQRKYEGDKINTVDVWHSPEWITHLLQKHDDYDSFRYNLENSVHMLMHINVGGIAGDLTNQWSSNDPIFYLIHAQIDRLWAKWQYSDPKRFWDYGGDYWNAEGGHYGRNTNLSELLGYYGTPVFHSHALIGQYTYDEFLNTESNDVDPFGSQAATDLILNLPEEMLAKYFPKFETLTANQYHVDFPPSCNKQGRVLRSAKASIDFIMAGLFDVSINVKNYKHNGDFVLDLNQYYLTPY